MHTDSFARVTQAPVIWGFIFVTDKFDHSKTYSAQYEFYCIIFISVQLENRE